ncbi:3'-5' exoribonuclease YhaM [Thermostilla marina]
MAAKKTLTSLSSLQPGEEGVFFALLSKKEVGTTRDGKPYFRVTFRDAEREVTFPVWSNSRWAEACREDWLPGTCYKLQATLQETQFGHQLDIRRIRPASDDDRAEGFDPDTFLPQSRFDREAMWAELIQIVEGRIEHPPVKRVVLQLLEEHAETWKRLPAARAHHHAYIGGLLQHTLSVVKTAVFLAEKYASLYDDLQPPLDTDMVVAGAVLHDVGKLLELETTVGEARYSPEGALLGHMLLGRDLVRDAALAVGLDDERRLRLEHVVIAHQRLPEWGAPKPPMTPEALLVHFADDCDAKFEMMADILRNEPGDEPLTSSKNLLHQQVFRGRPE